MCIFIYLALLRSRGRPSACLARSAARIISLLNEAYSVWRKLLFCTSFSHNSSRKKAKSIYFHLLATYVVYIFFFYLEICKNMLNLLLKKGPQIFLPIEEIAGYLDPFENTICRKLDLRYLIVLDRARISYT